MPQPISAINQQYWRHPSLPLIELRSTFQSQQGYKAHSHAQLSIGLVIAGQTRLKIAGQELLVNAGDLILIEPDKVHACNPIADQPRSYHKLYVDSQWCLNQLSDLYGHQVTRLSCDQVIIPKIQHASAQLAPLFLTMVEQLKNYQLTAANLTFEQLALPVLATWCSPANNDSDHNGLALQIKRRLLHDLVEPPTLEHLAHDLARSQETIIRAFSKQFGITPKSFINNARIEQAKLLLRQGISIVDVAIAVGFSDQSQFHRAFVRYSAATPRQYQLSKSIFDNKS